MILVDHRQSSAKSIDGANLCLINLMYQPMPFAPHIFHYHRQMMYTLNSTVNDDEERPTGGIETRTAGDVSQALLLCCFTNEV